MSRRQRIITILTTVWLTLCFLTQSRSDESAVADADVDRWIGQLASESFIQRDYASRQLMAGGGPVARRLMRVARGTNTTAANAAINLLGRLALSDDRIAGAAAHRELAKLSSAPKSLTESQRGAVSIALRNAERHVVGIVTALGGSIERDDALEIVALKVNDARFTDVHATVLSRLVRLHKLDLRGSGITDQSLEAIALLTALEELNIADTQVTAAGLRALAPLKKLSKLSLYRVEITAEDMQWLIDQHPDCDIRR